MNIPSEALELAAWEIAKAQEFGETLYKWTEMDDNEREPWISAARKVVAQVAPFIAAAALVEAADAAREDELTTAAEVIYDLRARATKELRRHSSYPYKLPLDHEANAEYIRKQPEVIRDL